MPKKIKVEETKASKPKTNINVKKTIKKYIARPIAFVTLFVFSAYGIRHALESLQDPMQVALTILFSLGLGFILFDND